MMLWNIYFQLIRAPCKVVILVSDSRVNRCSSSSTSNGNSGSSSRDSDSGTSSNSESEGASSILVMTLLKIVTVVLWWGLPTLYKRKILIRGRRRHGLISDQEIPHFRNGLVQTLQMSVEMLWPELSILNNLIGLWARQFVPLMTDRLH